MSEAGNQIFKHAKERLYSLESSPNKREKSSWKRIAGILSLYSSISQF